MRSSKGLPLTDLRNVCGMLRNVAMTFRKCNSLETNAIEPKMRNVECFLIFFRKKNAKTFHIPQNHVQDADNEQITIAECYRDIPQHSASIPQTVRFCRARISEPFHRARPKSRLGYPRPTKPSGNRKTLTSSVGHQGS